jgi:hypothetical protein
MYESQLTLEAAKEKLAQWSEQRGSEQVGENARGAENNRRKLRLYKAGANQNKKIKALHPYCSISYRHQE